ncbi:hypothetical protein CGCF415_v006622 [Colletotrichum fructicola]|nr:hypothetical protein CGCF415_v006622 [Colletotrichum fructicola]KAF4928084.1 hypothetical protein CGCF245_v012825 [Colletotrichum fructicola]KAF5509818.1 hypothetical protein CGCF413_v003287 [Colletotrichum fructicola]
MDHQSQNEQFGMERGVIQAVSDDVVSFNNEIPPPTLTQATHEGLFNFHVEEEDVLFYERLTEALRIDAQSPPNNLLDAEQDMVAVATDEANNEQASFYSQARPQANYDDISRRLSREEMDAYSRDILGPNNLLGFEGDMRVNNGQTPFLSQAYPQLPSVPQPSPVPAAQNIDPRLMEAPVAQAPTFAGAASLAHGTPYLSPVMTPSPAQPQPLVVPEALKPNTAGNRVKKAGGKKTGNKIGRKIGQRACDSCRKSHLTCKTETGANSCNQCWEKKTPCNQGSTADKRTKKSNEQGFLNTVDACKKYLKDLLILIFGMHDAKPEIKQGNMPLIGKMLSNDHPDSSTAVDLLTMKPLDEVAAQARVRLDALANLQLDLEGIHRVTEMRKHTKLCIERTREHVITLGRYLHVLMDGTYDAESVDFSLATVVGSPAPFSQIGQEMKAGFSHSDSGVYVDSLVGYFDRMVATISGK